MENPATGGWPFCHDMSPEIADLIGEVLTDFPVTGVTWGSSSPGLEVLAALEMEWSVRAQLPAAPEVCVRAACAVQLLWELSPPALGDVVLPRNAHYPGREQEGSICIQPTVWLCCQGIGCGADERSEISPGGSRGMSCPCHLQSVFTSHSVLVPRARPGPARRAVLPGEVLPGMWELPGRS